MFETRVPLTSPVDSGHRTEIERRLYFVSSDIDGFALVEQAGAITEILLRSVRPLDGDELGEKVRYVVDNDVAGRPVARRKVIWQSGDRDRRFDPVYEQMVAAGMAFETGEGQVALGGDVPALMDHFDAVLTRLVTGRFGARQFQYPTLIPTRVLEKVGYVSSFPQFLMFVTRLHSDTDVYRSFAENPATGADILAHCDNVDYCLPPTMCFHTFQQYAGRVFTAGENQVVTARGKSFRHESRYATALERLWDFTIREIVFMGTREFVLAARGDLMRDVFGYLDRIGVTGFCEVANDPFFCDADTSGRILTQRLLELKYELRADIGGQRSIAVGSFNYHDKFFSQSMDIQQAGGDWISTACAGFGLERLTYAFLCQHGIAREQWPDDVRSAVEERLR